jgi:cytochrome P450
MLTESLYPETSDPSLNEFGDRLRGLAPAVPVELPGGLTAWSVTRFALVRSLAADDRVSRDPARHWKSFSSVPDGWPLRGFLLSPTVLNTEGVDHRRLRARMELSFSTSRLETLGTRVQRTVEDLLERLEGEPGVVDIRGQYALPLAAQTLWDLFGVPENLRDRANAVLPGIIAPSPDHHEADQAVGEALAFLGELLTRAASDRGSAMGDDAVGEGMVRDLVAPAGEHSGSGYPGSVGSLPELTAEERLLALAITIAGGVPSTTELITNCIYQLLIAPRYRQAAVDGEVTWSDVIEETMRVDSPVQHMPLRYATTDIDLGEGVRIKAGEAILLGFGPAGRDPSVYGATATLFDPSRDATPGHLAMGHGIHYCIGAQLGRMEASAAVSALLLGFPALSMALPPNELVRQPMFVFNGLTQLPVRLRG